MSALDIYFMLAPEGRGIVKVFDKHTQQHFDKTIYRKYQTYGTVPGFDPALPKSYMYNTPCPIPAEFQSIWKLGQKEGYNQMIVNWYEPRDFIEPHRDCTAKLTAPMKPIKVYYCSEIGSHRLLRFINVTTGDVITQKLDAEFGVYEISEQMNKEYRHEILPGTGRYISFTFRQVCDY